MHSAMAVHRMKGTGKGKGENMRKKPGEKDLIYTS